jgi:hypothetical protein
VKKSYCLISSYFLGFCMCICATETKSLIESFNHLITCNISVEISSIFRQDSIAGLRDYFSPYCTILVLWLGNQALSEGTEHFSD